MHLTSAGASLSIEQDMVFGGWFEPFVEKQIREKAPEVMTQQAPEQPDVKLGCGEFQSLFQP